MRNRFLLVAGLVWIACGDGDSPSARGDFDYPQPNPTPPSQLRSQTQRPPTPATGVVHEVRMLRTADQRYVFAPQTLTIRDGDRVRWIVESGIPHNVAFYPESIPAGAAQMLAEAMAADGQVGPLAGPILTEPGQTFEILFAGVPAGRYRYVCLPHEVTGMKGTLVVRTP